MNKKIITITGYSASGKSTIIKSIEEEFDCDTISFGQIHKECVKDSNYDYAKDWIRKEGFEAYEKQLILHFMRKMIFALKEGKQFVIIDGIFSERCFSYLKRAKGIDVTNIVLETDDNTRILRMSDRERVDYEVARSHLITTDAIKKQAGLDTIFNFADYRIDGNQSKKMIRKILFSIMQNLGCCIKSREEIIK